MKRSSPFFRSATAAPVLLCIAVALAQDDADFSVGCDRRPNGHASPKTPGDNGFRLVVHTYPSGYAPGRVYTLSLLGQNTGDYAQTFRGFMVAALPEVEDAAGARPGTLQIMPRYGSSRLSADPGCSSAVVETANNAKTRVDVKWKAPRTGSGCVLLRATVVERRHIWYRDDGALTVRLCEKPEAREEDRGRRRHGGRHRGSHGSLRPDVSMPTRVDAGGGRHSASSSPDWIDPLSMFRRGSIQSSSREDPRLAEKRRQDEDRRQEERRRHEEERQRIEAERRQGGNEEDRRRVEERRIEEERRRQEEERRRQEEERKQEEEKRQEERKQEEERRRLEAERRQVEEAPESHEDNRRKEEENRAEERRRYEEERRKQEAERRKLEEDRRLEEERRREESRRREEERLKAEREEERRRVSSPSSSDELLRQKSVCMQPATPGPCRAAIPRFAFDPETGLCVRFLFGGCRGNDNNFETSDECRNACRLLAEMIRPGRSGSQPVEPANGPRSRTGPSSHRLSPEDVAALKEICMAPLDTGPCRASFPRFGFSPEKGMCVPFLYGGCVGNDNNFDTETKCLDKCGPVAEMLSAGPVTEAEDPSSLQRRKHVCMLPRDEGPCLGSSTAFGFNPEKLMCEQFVYGGCQGNENRFPSKEECENECLPVRRHLIDAASIRDPTRRQPTPTLALMEAKRVCMMPPEVGRCRAAITKFAFNADKAMCVPFVYGGCGGNENNFEDEASCLDKCRPLRDMLTAGTSSVVDTPVVSTGDLVPVVSPSSFGGMSLEERKRICMLPLDPGPCRAAVHRFAYAPEKFMCVPFSYGGCDGNDNNFATENQCRGVCRPLIEMGPGGVGGEPSGAAASESSMDEQLVESKRVCSQPRVTGRCRASIPRFGFDLNKRMCVRFTYGGCGANDNNFSTEKECLMACDPLRRMLEVSGGGAIAPKRRGKKPRKNKDKHFGASGSQPRVNRLSPGPPCCACGEAKYKIVFKGIWSPNTHPKDFPTQLFLTHWSDLVGGSHSRRFRIYESGGYASEGLKWVAEYGSTFNLEKELKQHSDNIRTVIKTRGLWYPKVQESTSAYFSVNQSHHLMSFVSMLGPSPDWFVGLDSLNLCRANCTWRRRMSFDLRPIDAGTDSGITYMSANAATVPRERVRPITSTDPDNPRQPFYDPSGRPVPPVAKIYIKREKLVGNQCGRGGFGEEEDNEEDDFDAWGLEEAEESFGAGSASSGEKLEATHPKCAVGEWNPWSPCSSTCGNGLRGRTRALLMPDVPASMCDVQLKENEMCMGPAGECDPNDPCALDEWSSWSPCGVSCGSGVQMRTRTFSRKDRAVAANCEQAMVEKRVCEVECDALAEVRCMTTPWSDWSDCSVTCGRGFRMRNRKFAKEGMLDVSSCQDSLVEKQECLAIDCDGAETPPLLENPQSCATTSTGPWTKCSTACGRGIMTREMVFLDKRKAIESGCDMSVLEERKDCVGIDCADDDADDGATAGEIEDDVIIRAKRVCLHPAVTGRCRANMPRFAYDANKAMCVPFVYGGCGGNDNKFKSERECLDVCGVLTKMAPAQSPIEDDSHTDEEIEAVIGPRLPLIGESAAGKRLKTYKARDKFFFDDNRNEGVPHDPVVQAEDPNIPIRENWEDDDEDDDDEEALREKEKSEWKSGRVQEGEEEEDHDYDELEQNIEDEKENIKDDTKNQKRGKARVPVDCVVSEWSEWSPCSASCGKSGRRFRQRGILSKPKRGGVKCPRKKALRERERCRSDADTPGCGVDCVMGEWGPWSGCGKTCGEGGVQKRNRKRIVKPRLGGLPCAASREKRYCTLPACPDE